MSNAAIDATTEVRMRISELSATTGVTVPTIKFYLREGLLPAGTTLAINQADYDESHVRRLRLIRALIDIGGLRLRDVRDVLAALDDDRVPVHDLLGVTQAALGSERRGPGRSSAVDPTVAAEVDEAVARLGWKVNDESRARETLADTLVTLRGLGWTVPVDDLVSYGRAVNELAAREVASVPETGVRSAILEHMVIGTVLFETILDAMRLLAQEHHSAQRFAPPEA